MAAVTGSVDYICVFCTSTNNDLVDPRELPCGHVGCRICLIGWIEESEHGNLVCHRCYQLHRRLDFDSLKKIVIDGVSTTLTCDGFDCGVPSVSYCVECDSKFCDTHLQAHNACFGPKHEQISIDVYQQSPGRYKKVYCDNHKNEPFVEACKQCYKLVCLQCKRSESHCTDAVTQHEYKTLEEVSQKITSGLKERLKFANDFRKEIFSHEKESWKNLDVVIEECEERIKEIERVRDEQIRNICKESEREKNKVQEYLRKSITMVEASSAVLLAAKDQLDVSCIRVRKLMKDGHMTDLIKQMTHTSSGLTQNADVEFDKSTSVKADFTQLPPALTLTSEHDMVGCCHSVCHRADGDILVTCEDEVKVLDRKTGQLTDWDLPYKNVYSAVEHHHIFYVLHREGSICKVQMSPPDSKRAMTLFKFETKSVLPSLAVSNRHVVVSIGDTHDLVIYDRMSHTLTKQKFQAWHVHLGPNGQLLTKGDDQLVKYNIAGEQLTKIWECRGLDKISEVIADFNGTIFASTYNRQSVYVISPAGELLREIKHNKLPALPGRISVRDSELAVLGWQDNKLYIFKVHY